MRIHHWMVAAAMSAAAAVAIAKLPPPAPEAPEAAAAKKEQAAALLEKEKQSLERAQNRVVEYYKRTKAAPGANTQRSGQTEAKNLPNNVTVPPGEAGPQGGRKQSAEAHSAPAK